MEEMPLAKKLFFYAAPFPAMASFKIWASQEPGPSSLLVGSGVMLVYCLIVLFLESRWWRAGYFEWTMTIYFAVILTTLALWPVSAEKLWVKYSVTGIYSCLFAASFIPPLFGKDPFTYHYAKLITPKSHWDNPIFVKVNRHITFVWSGLFAVCLILSLYPSVITRAIIPLGLIVGFGTPFSRKYPDRYLRKLGLPGLAEQKKIEEDMKGVEKSRKQPRAGLDTAWAAVAGMADSFKAEAAGDMDAVIKFQVTGNEEFEICLEIKNGECSQGEHPSRDPDLIIRTPADVWLSIAKGERDGSAAFVDKEYTVSGDMSILLKMDYIFG